MKFNYKVQMAIEDFKEFIDDEDISLAFGNVTFLSTKPNSHKHRYTEEVIREYAPTYLGKFLVAEYNKMSQDVTTHTSNQSIVGYIPKNQEVKYETDKDGYFNASVDVVVSKIYAKEVYDLFKFSNERKVSVEQLVGFTPETESNEDGVDEKDVVGFEGIGITLLGIAFNPSIPNANIKLTQMSEDNIGNIEMEYVKYSKKEEIITNKSEFEQKLELDKEEKMSEILNKLEQIEKRLDMKKNINKYAVEIGDTLWSKVWSLLRKKYPYEDEDGYCYGSIYGLKGIYEEDNQKFIIVEERDSEKMYRLDMIYTEDEFSLSDNFIEVEQVFIETNQMELFKNEDIKKYELKIKEDSMAEKETKPVDDKKPEEEKMVENPKKMEDDIDDDDKDEMKTKMADLEKKVEEYEKEITQLKEFKEEKLKTEKMSIISSTLSKIKEFVDETTYDETSKSGESCKYEDIKIWEAKTLAMVTDKVISKISQLSSKEDGILDMGMPKDETKTEKCIYD